MRILPCLLLLLAACAVAPVAPPALPDAFRTGMDPRFPPTRFLVAVADGASLEAARRRALAEIAAQLQASVFATDVVSATSSSSGAGEERLEQAIRVESRFDRPEWVRIADATVHEGRVYVIAVLDRTLATAQLEVELGVQRAALRQRIERARREPDLRKRSESLAEAAALVRTHVLPATATLAALQGAPAQAPPEIDLVARARDELEAERRTLAIRVCVSSALPQGLGVDLADRFAAILSGEGVQAIPCESAGAAWLLSGRLVAATRGAPRTAGAWERFCTARLDYELTDELHGTLLRGGSAGGGRNEAGGRDFHDACQASAASLARGLAEELGLRDAR